MEERQTELTMVAISPTKNADLTHNSTTKHGGFIEIIRSDNTRYIWG